MEKIEIGGRKFEVTVKYGGVRGLRLRLREKNKIEVRAAYLTPNFLIKKFIEEHQNWILKNNQKLAGEKDLTKIKYLEILGEKYEMESKKSLRDSMVIIGEKIFLNYSDKRKIKKLLDQKMRPWAARIIRERLAEMAGEKNLKYGRISVKNQSSRFGSCSYRGDLNFNWQIILFPKDKFDHILWHELAHLTVKNHSRDFWELLRNYDPKAQEDNRWIRKEAGKRLIV